MCINKCNYIFMLLLLCGCTSLPENYGKDDVDSMLQQRNVSIKNKNIEIERHTELLLSAPMSVSEVTQMALIKNSDLKKIYSELGFAAADVYQAGRIRNPIFSYSQLDSNQSGEQNLITLGFITSLADLLTLPSRRQLALQQLSLAKKSVGSEILNVIAEVQHAYFKYHAASQISLIKKQIHKVEQLSYELAKRYHQAGNIGERELLEEAVKAKNAKVEMLRADSHAHQNRLILANLLNLKIDGDWEIVTVTYLPSDDGKKVDQLVSLAHRSRLDLLASHEKAQLLANRLDITNWSRLIGDLDAGFEWERETDGARLNGPTVELELPIFNQHADQNIRAYSELEIALAEVSQLTNQINNEIQLRVKEKENARLRVNEYLNNIIPTKSAIVERAQQQENYMLIGTFELLHTKVKEYQSYIGLLEAISDFWIAHFRLMHAAGDSLSYEIFSGAPVIDVGELINQNTMHEHAHH